MKTTKMLALLALVLAGALIANIWLRRLWLPVTAAGIWVALLLVGQLYPAAIQYFFVTPSARSYEIPYIQREIAGTRAAYGLSNVTVSNFTGDQPLQRLCRPNIIRPRRNSG